MELNYGKLRRARLLKRMSLSDVARELNLNKSTLSRYENGASRIPAITLVELLQLYDMDLSDVIIRQVSV